jgi:hypothetical protein
MKSRTWMWTAVVSLLAALAISSFYEVYPQKVGALMSFSRVPVGLGAGASIRSVG